jgi:hypothetical protein
MESDYIYIYIYIYMCVCVCVCVERGREREREFKILNITFFYLFYSMFQILKKDTVMSTFHYIINTRE